MRKLVSIIAVTDFSVTSLRYRVVCVAVYAVDLTHTGGFLNSIDLETLFFLAQANTK